MLITVVLTFTVLISMLPVTKARLFLSRDLSSSRHVVPSLGVVFSPQSSSSDERTEQQNHGPFKIFSLVSDKVGCGKNVMIFGVTKPSAVGVLGNRHQTSGAHSQLV